MKWWDLNRRRDLWYFFYDSGFFILLKIPFQEYKGTNFVFWTPALQDKNRPEDSHLLFFVIFDEFILIDSPNTQLTFHGGDQWRSLEESASQLKMIDMYLAVEMKSGKTGEDTFSRACLIFFSLSTGLCSLKMATYSFPAPCWDLARRVVRSMHTIKQPDT